MMLFLAHRNGVVAAFVFPVILLLLASMVAGVVVRKVRREDAMMNAFPATGALTVIDEL